MLTKKELLKQLIINKLNLLQCPICQSKMDIQNNSFVCNQKHLFDISKKGIVLLHRKYQKKLDEIYTKDLFLNRREFILNGFYTEVYNYINSVILEGTNKSFNILDLGSGECSHLKLIKCDKSYTAFGIDLAYDAISLATDYLYDNIIPICCDLYNLPFRKNTFDVILNFLSPINSIEVNRVLNPNGIIIKVIPTSNYLKELREQLNLCEYEKEDDVLANLYNQFSIVSVKRVETQKTLDDLTRRQLFHMTPMTNHFEYLKCDIDKITISLDIVVMRKK